jgi:hypothetical protein
MPEETKLYILFKSATCHISRISCLTYGVSGLPPNVNLYKSCCLNW